MGNNGGHVEATHLPSWVDTKLVEGILEQLIFLGPWVSRGFINSVKIGLAKSVGLRSTVFQTGEHEYLCLVPLGLVIRLDYFARLLEREGSKENLHIVDPDYYGDLPKEVKARRALLRPPPPLDLISDDTLSTENFWSCFREIDTEDGVQGRSLSRERQIDLVRQAVLFCALHESAHALRLHHEIVSLSKNKDTANRGAELDADAAAGRWLAFYRIQEFDVKCWDDSKQFGETILESSWRLSYGVCLALGLFDVDRLAIGTFAQGQYHHPTARLQMACRGILDGFGPVVGKDLTYASLCEASGRAAMDYSGRADNLATKLSEPYPSRSFRRPTSIYLSTVRDDYNLPFFMQDRLDPEFPTLRKVFREASGELKDFLSENDDSLNRASQVGADHPDVASTLTNVGTLLRRAHRFQEAEALFRQALVINEKRLGQDDPYVATDLTNLAVVLTDTSRFEEAETLFRQALTIDEKNLTSDHPNIARDLSNLAVLFVQTNRFKEAEPLYRQALPIEERHFGPDHPEVARRLNDLGFCLRETGRYEEALDVFQRAVRIWEQRAPEQSGLWSDWTTSLNNLAGCLSALGRRDDALKIVQKAMCLENKWLNNDSISPR